jgi:ABC-type multidrug transport system ATPase subunit
MPESIEPSPPPSPDPVVTLRGVSVAYGKNWALRDVTATFRPGAVGLLGPNGAGKSTMIKSLLGFIKPDQGQMRVLGPTSPRHRSRFARASATCLKTTATSRA